MEANKSLITDIVGAFSSRVLGHLAEHNGEDVTAGGQSAPHPGAPSAKAHKASEEQDAAVAAAAAAAAAAQEAGMVDDRDLL